MDIPENGLMNVHELDAFHGIGYTAGNSSDAEILKREVNECLQKIRAIPLGDELPNEIRDARPARRTGAQGPENLQAIVFPPGVNVVFIPASVRSGMDPRGKAAAANRDVDAAQDGRGSVVFVFFQSGNFTSGQSDLEVNTMIVTAHELIHCYNSLNGNSLPNNEQLLMESGRREEEWAAVGLGPYMIRRFTENRFRLAAGLPPRNTYP